MNRLWSVVIAVVLGWGAANSALGDAAPALDTADDIAYDAGWTNNSNGGYGFGPWSISVGSAGGTFIGSSTNNGGGSGGIDTSGESWGMWSSTTGSVDVYRSFTNGTLGIGESFLIDLDNGWVNSGGSVGLGLQNSAGGNLWEFYFVGGDQFYTINDNGGATTSGIAYTADGLSLEFSLTGSTSYNFNVTAYYEGGGSSTNFNFTGNLISQTDQQIARFHLWSFQAGDGPNYDFFANSAQVVPEPTTATLILSAGAALAIVRRRQRKG